MDIEKQDSTSTDDPDIHAYMPSGLGDFPLPPDEETEPAHVPGDENWGGKGRDFHYAYPDYHSYDRSGNGHTFGDKHPWVFRVQTDNEGDGEFVVRFPTPASPSGDPPGAENWRPIDSWVVWVAFANTSFGFGKYKNPQPSMTFEVAEYQRTFWRLRFVGPPNSVSVMSVMRLVNFSGMARIPAQVPVTNGPDHGDL